MAVNPAAGQLAADLVARLSQDPKPDDERDMLVLAALDGPEALNGYLDSHAEPSRPEPLPEAEKNREPLGAYLKTITVEGFRGIGQKATLDLPPGPGLTLVVGRNGSGKSSFAEALELLLTGDTYRWANARRGLAAKAGATCTTSPRPSTPSSWSRAKRDPPSLASWTDDADLDAAETYAQIHGKPRRSPKSSAGRTPSRPTGPSSPTTSSARCSTRARRSSSTRSRPSSASTS